MSATYLTPESTTTKVIHRKVISERKARQDTGASQNWWSRFVLFTVAQERNRFGWLAAGITLQGCVLAPLTLLAIISNGNPFALWIPCIIAFAVTEVVNLAALPTRITIPVLFAGIIVDICVVATCFIFY